MPKERVFLAWSGPCSKAVATALRKWLPKVIQNLDPWMSENDIDKGTRWLPEVSGQLENLKMGIICLTPQNLREPWINFEAGALSKTRGSVVCTYLHGLETTDVPQPLAQFQGTRADKDDTRKLLETLNAQLGEEGLEQSRLDESFIRWWPDLETDLSHAEESPAQTQAPRSQDDMLKEILTTLRSHSNSYAAFEGSLANIQGLLQNQTVSVTSNTIPGFGFSGISTSATAPFGIQQGQGLLNSVAPSPKRRIIPEGIKTSNEEGSSNEE